MNRKFLSIILLIGFFSFTYAGKNIKEVNDYQFEIVKQLPVTSVKDQHKTSTCWSFSVLSMLESELLRMTEDTFDLSEMYIVRNTYKGKARKFVRLHGHMRFTGGGALNDPVDMIEKHGIVPDSVYSGLQPDESKHNHHEMDGMLKAYVEELVNNNNENISLRWFEGYLEILNTYLGKKPERFVVNGEQHTPESYRNSLGLEMDDYVLISSFTHHPFYEQFIIEVPDNWSWGKAYNVPLDEMKEILNHALDNDYSIAWASDVSDRGFDHSKGLAIVPEKPWDEMNVEEKDLALYEPVRQRTITQKMRQVMFDNYSTTDDHGMHIVGKAVDQKGTPYFYVKNSWGTDKSEFDGYFFASEAYVLLKTLSFMVNKEAIPTHIRNKLNL
mgnify:FL=1